MTEEKILRVVFGNWVWAREFARREGLTLGTDVIVALGQDLSHVRRRIVPYEITWLRPPGGEDGLERWRRQAAEIRAINENNGFETEVVRVHAD